jgi:hypothetical protein
MRSALPWLCVAFSLVAGAAEPAPPTAAFWSAALSPAGRTDLTRVRPATTWQLTVRVDDAAGTIEGDADLVWRNDERVAVPDLCLQTLPNSEAFHQAAVKLSNLRVAGAEVRSESLVGGAGTRVLLPTPVAPGATVHLTCHFTTTPSTTGGMHGLLSRSGKDWCLYAWYPELALRREGAWQVDPVQDFTDPTRTATAHVRLDLDVPEAMQVVSGGTEVARTTAAGRTQLTIAAPFTRNLALVLSQGLVVRTREVDGITVRSWYRPEDVQGGTRVLTACTGSMKLFNQRFGPFPFNELDAVEMPLGDDDVGGMESTGLVMIDSRPYFAVRFMDDQADASVLPVFMLLNAAAHETGHQWWYSLVGNDPYRDPWLDESLTNWSGNYWMEQEIGPGAGTMAFSLCYTGLSVEPKPNPDRLPMTNPVPSYPNHSVYGAVIYARGALFYQWLRAQLGEEQFFAFIKAWCAEQRYAVATPTAWRSTLLRFAPLTVVQTAEEKWLKGKGLTAADMAGASRAIAPAAPAKR